MYVYVPNATASNAMTNMIAAADENSFTVGVGVAAVGSVTELLVGMNIGCTARAWFMVVESVVSVDIVPPTPPSTIQHSNLKPVPGAAVKV